MSATFRTWRERRRLSSDLGRLSDHLLADAGVERDGIGAHVRAAMPWPEADTPPKAFAPRLQGCG